MKLKTKKIIAREILIFIGVVILGIVLDNIFGDYHCTDSSGDFCFAGYKAFSIIKLFLTIITYLGIRLIIWAIKTLKKKGEINE
jgi:hypothetical protein